MTKTSYQSNVHTADWHNSFRPNYNEKYYAGGQETNKENWSSNNFVYCRSSTLLCGFQCTVGLPRTFWRGFHPSSWGMHFLLSYIGAVGVLMAGSGLKELLKAAFGGVMKMLTGNNFPQNTRALRIVVEQVVHQILCEVNTFDELMQELKARASKSRTAKHWGENLILPVLLMLIFIRAEREGEWGLHLWAVNEMIPYFFAAGHIHYCQIWPNPPHINAKAAWGNPRKIFEGRTCPTPQTRTVERDMDRHVHRDIIYALWAQARWSHWNNTEWESCP